MPSSPRARRRWWLWRAVVTCAVLAAPLAPATAAADEPAGSTVTGELVRVVPEEQHVAGAGHASEEAGAVRAEPADGAPAAPDAAGATTAGAGFAEAGTAEAGAAGPAADEGATLAPDAAHATDHATDQAADHAADHAAEPTRDAADPAAHAVPLSYVETPDGRSVRVDTDDVADVPAGATVEVTVGAEVRDAASGDGHVPAREVLHAQVVSAPAPAPVAAGTGRRLTNEVTVALVRPAGVAPDSVALARMTGVVVGPVAGFWAEQTGGAVQLGVTAAHDWLPTVAGCADPTLLWNEVAAKVGFVPGPGRHLVLYLSSHSAALPGCSYALAEVGAGPTSGGRVYVRDALPSVIAHELGHNFGLGHSSGLQCDGTADAAVDTGACRTKPYRDHYDVMGVSWGQLGSLNVAQAAALGTLDADRVRTVNAAEGRAEVVLAPLGAPTGTRALRLDDGRGGSYWLELRTAAGRDAWLGTAADRFALDSGVLLRRTGSWPDTSLLLDGTPGPAAGWDGDLRAALPPGAAVALAGGFTVTVTSLTTGAATVLVEASSTAAGRVIPAPAGGHRDAVLPAEGCAACTAPGTGTPGMAATPAPAVPAAPGGDADPAPAPGTAAPADPPGAADVHATEASRASAAPAATAPVGPVAAAALGGLVLGAAGVLLRRRLR